MALLLLSDLSDCIARNPNIGENFSEDSLKRLEVARKKLEDNYSNYLLTQQLNVNNIENTQQVEDQNILGQIELE